MAKLKKPRVVVVVDGGLVQATYANAPVNVEVVDCDNLEAEGHSKRGIEKIVKAHIKGMKEVHF
jgi:hypothetical protein